MEGTLTLIDCTVPIPLTQPSRGELVNLINEFTATDIINTHTLILELQNVNQTPNRYTLYHRNKPSTFYLVDIFRPFEKSCVVDVNSQSPHFFS